LSPEHFRCGVTAGDTSTSTETTPPDEAFAALSDETRLRAIQTVAATAQPTFTELYEASDAETTAGFAYHLRQLTDRYLRKDPETERYELTAAGRAVARALDAGTFTERVDREPTAVDSDCPVCETPALLARVDDNTVSVACRACETELLSLPFPPSGLRGRDTETVLSAFDSYHRRRTETAADGVCPDCAAEATGRIVFEETPDLPGSEPRPVVESACERCDFRLRVPVSLTVRDHPAVVSLSADHDAGLLDRPIWNLGPEWQETVLSEDPPAVAVSVTVEGERVRLLVGDGPAVVDVERSTVEPADDANNAVGDVDSSLDTEEALGTEEALDTEEAPDVTEAHDLDASAEAGS
jgi:hypothetical protein